MLTEILGVTRSLFCFGSVDNRRRLKRHQRCTLLTLRELDDDLSPIGSSKWAMSRDINEAGIGFVCRDEIRSTYLRVLIVEDNYSAIGIVRHSRRMADGEYFIGVEFLDDDACHER